MDYVVSILFGGLLWPHCVAERHRLWYTGPNWSINVAKRALNIGLDDDLTGSFNGVKAVNREEACLYAFNTLKATFWIYGRGPAFSLLWSCTVQSTLKTA